MRIAAVGDIHGRENLEAFRGDLARLGPVDLVLLAGDTTERNDLEAFEAVLREIRARIDGPVWAVFGNNEYAHDHPAYLRIADAFGVRILQDEAATLATARGSVRIVGSLGSLDRPTWWQRKNLPHLAGEYERRIGALDALLPGPRPCLLLTHYPPTYVTMGGEKEAWRPELGCRALEATLQRRRPDLVVHGHIHRGIPFAELRAPTGTLDAILDPAPPIPVHNVAYPVRRSITTLEVGDPASLYP